MASNSLPSMLDEVTQLLNYLLSDDCPITRDPELAGKVHATWMKMKNWESDIKNKEKCTLQELDDISPRTAEIVRSRLVILLQQVRLIKGACTTTESGQQLECREVVESTYRAAVDVIRTTRTLRGLIHARCRSFDIEQVASTVGEVFKNWPLTFIVETVGDIGEPSRGQATVSSRMALNHDEVERFNEPAQGGTVVKSTMDSKLEKVEQHAELEASETSKESMHFEEVLAKRRLSDDEIQGTDVLPNSKRQYTSLDAPPIQSSATNYMKYGSFKVSRPTAEREPRFRVADDVRVKKSVENRHFYMKCIIASTRMEQLDIDWQYQLIDLNGALVDDGKWHEEYDIHSED